MLLFARRVIRRELGAALDGFAARWNHTVPTLLEGQPDELRELFGTVFAREAAELLHPLHERNDEP